MKAQSDTIGFAQVSAFTSTWETTLLTSFHVRRLLTLLILYGLSSPTGYSVGASSERTEDHPDPNRVRWQRAHFQPDGTHRCRATVRRAAVLGERHHHQHGLHSRQAPGSSRITRAHLKWTEDLE